jgi:hypothetical protein
MYETTSDLNEVIYYERLDADLLQAQYEAEGNRAARRSAKVERLLAEGDREAATKLCSHGHVGGLKGSCSQDDPRYGEIGCRCYECGAVVNEIHGVVLHVD